jgi:SAM-dependent methyltransferase
MTLPDLCASVWAFAALRVAVDTDLLVAMAAGETDASALATAAGLDAAVTVRLLDTLAVHGFVERPSAAPLFRLTTDGQELAARPDWVRADLATTSGQTTALVHESRMSNLGQGWQHADPELIRAQSMMSRLLAEQMLDRLVPEVPELTAALAQPNARFLDAGAGGAAIAMAFCRRFPSLRAVGLDPLRSARLEARAALVVGGLADRVELRSTRVEELAEERVYAAAFVAAPFMSDAVLAAGLARVARALVPGGHVFLGVDTPPRDPRQAAAAKLRLQLWGGGTRSPEDAVRLAEKAGLVDVRQASTPGNLVPILARAAG